MALMPVVNVVVLQHSVYVRPAHALRTAADVCAQSLPGLACLSYQPYSLFDCIQSSLVRT